MATEAIYTKSLGGAEDLLLDASNSATVIQTRAGKELEITKINSSTIPYSGKFGDPSMVSIKDKIDLSAYTVETIEDILTVPVEYNTVIVKDINSGGIFVSKTEVDIDQNTGSVYTINGGTVFAKLGGGFWVRQYSGAVNVKWFGAVGDGITNDTAAVQSALPYTIAFTDGTYNIGSTEFIKDVIVKQGAVIKTTTGHTVIFNTINAGDYTIFDTNNDFITNYNEDTCIKILGCEVQVDWFAAKVLSAADIKSIPDQTNNIMKAMRSAMGNFTGTSPNFKNEYASGVVKLGVGRYRVDNTICFGKAIGGIYYRVNGCRFTGHGSASSYLYRTDLGNLAYIFNSVYTGELTTIDNFKINAYDPDSTNVFSSASRAGMYLQGDSLHLNNIWISGMQVPITDTNGIARNGIGIQFSSCVDTYMHDMFIENCVTGYAFGSSIVSGVNIESYSTSQQAFGIGIFVDTWGDTQTTSSRISLSNIQCTASALNAITVLEDGSSDKSYINISNSLFDGYNSEVSQQVGTRFIKMKVNTTIKPNFTNVEVLNYSYRVFDVGTGCSLGDVHHSANFVNCKFYKQTADVSSGVFYCAGHAIVNINSLNCSFIDIAGVLYGGVMNSNSSQVTISNAYISGFTGKVDASTNRQFVSGSGNINLSNFTRDISDTTVLNHIGYWGNGRIYIDFSPNLWNVTRAVTGSATKVMPTITTFA